MEMAYKAGMDVVNLSFGENGGWKEDIVAVMADRMVAHGVNGMLMQYMYVLRAHLLFTYIVLQQLLWRVVTLAQAVSF